jgi:hypothetical protein
VSRNKFFKPGPQRLAAVVQYSIVKDLVNPPKAARPETRDCNFVFTQRPIIGVISGVIIAGALESPSRTPMRDDVGTYSPNLHLEVFLLPLARMNTTQRRRYRPQMRRQSNGPTFEDDAFQLFFYSRSSKRLPTYATSTARRARKAQNVEKHTLG